MRVLTFAETADRLTRRYPQAGQPESGVIPSISGAQAERIEAAAVRSFNQPTAKLVFVKATEPFFVAAGEHVNADDYVQVQEPDAKRLIAAGRAVAATDDEVAQASKPDNQRPKK